MSTTQKSAFKVPTRRMSKMSKLAKIAKKMRMWSEKKSEISEGFRVRVVQNEDHFAKELWEANDKLVVAQFTAKWNVPSPKHSARFKVLSEMYPNARFLKVDVDRCKDTAKILQIYLTPLFVLYRNQDILEIIKGPDMKSLELFIAVHYGDPFEVGPYPGGCPVM